MKYYVFLLGVVLVMSFQNCSKSNSTSMASTHLTDITASLDDSTDTGNGSDYEANAFIQDIANFTFILCTKNEELTGTATYDCVNQLSDVGYYNKITEGVEFDSVPDYLRLADARALMVNTVSMNECKQHISTFTFNGAIDGLDVVHRVLEFLPCNSIIIPVPGYVN